MDMDSFANCPTYNMKDALGDAIDNVEPNVVAKPDPHKEN